MFCRKCNPGDKGGFRTNKVEIIIVAIVIIALASFAIPNYVKLKLKQKQSEAKFNLRSLSRSQAVFHAKNGFYADNFDVLPRENISFSCKPGGGEFSYGPPPWRPMPDGVGKIEYSYYITNTNAIAGTKGLTPLQPGVNAGAEKDRFVAVAVGNISNGSTLDVWTINEKGMYESFSNDSEPTFWKVVLYFTHWG